MEPLKLAVDFIGQNGILAFIVLVVGLVIITSTVRELLFLWKKFIKKDSNSLETRVKNLEDSKSRLDHRSYEKERDFERRMDAMETTIGEHLKKEQAEDIKIALLEQSILHNNEVTQELKENQGKIFSMISAIKDHLIPGK